MSTSSKVRIAAHLKFLQVGSHFRDKLGAHLHADVDVDAVLYAQNVHLVGKLKQPSTIKP